MTQQLYLSLQETNIFYLQPSTKPFARLRAVSTVKRRHLQQSLIASDEIHDTVRILALS